MQQSDSIDQIEARAMAVRLSLTELAMLASVAPSTLLRAKSGRHEMRRSIERKIVDALIAEELRLLGHLNALHGVPAS